MQGLLQKLTSEVTDDSLPRYYPADTRLNKGSLLLIQPANPLSLMPSFPVLNQQIRNLAWDIAKTMIPAGTESTLNSVVEMVPSGGTRSITELTPKKGLHTIISKLNDVLGNCFVIKHSDLIKNYILDNPTHQFFFSIWQHRTRTADTTTTADFYLYQNTSNYKTMFLNTDVAPGGSVPNNVGRRGLADNVTGVNIRNSANVGYVGNIAADRTTIRFNTKTGPFGSFQSFEVGKSGSLIMYEMYVEDMTVSGRTYAQCDAEDVALYTAAFAPGGLFYGDTFTAPSTLP